MKKNIKLIIAILFVAGIIWFIESKTVNPNQGIEKNSNITVTSRKTAEEKESKYEHAKEIVNPSGFINTDENFTIQNLIGEKIILVDFWTYSCINCQRTLPYLTAWYDKYKDQGLAIVGIHTPEFEFEKKYENVKQATENYGIDYPVVLDNDYATWRAYENRYWPRKYLIDIDGFIVYDHIGEGAYDETEEKIQELLSERKLALGSSENISGGIVAPSDMPETNFGKIKSPETYFGSARNSNLGNGKSGQVGIQTFEIPSSLSPNTLYLKGKWDIQNEFAQNKESSAEIIFRYSSKDVYMVASADELITIKVYRDDKLISDSITIKEDRLYKLIEGNDYEDHTIRIIINKPNLKAFTFTFG
ncbi:MAG: thiol-disulfide isomerase [Candidatus Harrisonbacteria bacterium CG10_big_fil_rev_8_21_14_0_10_40_38]|uniref:Thiol-disulfide isomerase n=1 Tax=Candidatus Harrisonbacteria bacterium CG10_big_fil_rev_8_21_14_0_10_40_38 TaxID=1974583 RepID=A0A2H0USA9_9BACT|nr:MAG: thiol-disulfide isomerase [Candidatus Harrisonbacteria bacterium CG10_big_fil_rev_8_21_14_0_10_40_38]